MTIQVKKSAALLGLSFCFSAGLAQAVDFQASDNWTLSLGGNVNGFLTSTNCDQPANAVKGGLACTEGKTGVGIRSGLLPSALVFGAKTRQEGYDIGATIGFYPNINSANLGAHPNSNIDARQAFLTVGTPAMGTIKAGRDIGVFGANAILNDMTLIGAGVPGGTQASTTTTATNGTTLGRIGTGYLYTAFQPQISYTSPMMNGFQAKAGLFQALPAQDILTGTTLSGHDQPGVQGQLSYDWKGSAPGQVWLGAISQRFSAEGAGEPSVSYRGNAVEAGLKAGANGFEGVLYGYSGHGIGTTLIGLGAINSAGETRKSDGYYAQGTYQFAKTKLGLSYGESRLKPATGDAGTNLVAKNKSTIAGVYHHLTKSVTLVGEYINTRSIAQNGTSARDNTVAAGAHLAF
jgi:predicted porin